MFGVDPGFIKEAKPEVVGPKLNQLLIAVETITNCRSKDVTWPQSVEKEMFSTMEHLYKEIRQQSTTHIMIPKGFEINDKDR